VIGIALGGGVARGWAHIGVLNRLEAAGLEPDIVCGTSIGALVGGSYLGGRMPEFEAWARGLTRAGMTRLFDLQLGASGLIAGRRITQMLPPDLRRLAIEELDRPFVAVATDLSNGHEVWIRTGSLTEAMRASYAVPGLFPPVYREGRWLVDGALVNPVPVSVCHALGADITIAVNLNGDPYEELPSAESGLDELAGLNVEASVRGKGRQGIIRSFFRRRPTEPGMLTVISQALVLGQDRIARSRLAGEPPDVMISPALVGIGLFEFYRAEEIIAAGEAAAAAAIPAIRALLQRYAPSLGGQAGIPANDGGAALAVEG
jgi:NTE family protein